MEIQREVKIEKRKKSPLVSSTSGILHPDSDVKLLVTCCNVNGGLYLISFSNDEFSYEKILDGDCRGMAAYEDGYIMASDEFGVLHLNNEFEILKRYKSDVFMDYHGVAIHNGRAYIAETALNTIGIYELEGLERIDEIVFESKDEDILHINDIFIEEEQMYVSMFLFEGKWRDKPEDSGVIVRLPMNNFACKEIVISNLKRPHSVMVKSKKIIYCNSTAFELAEDDDILFKCSGFLRGAESVDNTYYIGQSEIRNVGKTRHGKTNISIDSGIHVFNAIEKVSRFFKLPSPEIYGILDCSNRYKKDKVDAGKINLLNCQLFIDTGKDFNELESIRHSVNSGENFVHFDISKYTNINALRFDPVDTPCILIIKNMIIETECGAKQAAILNHNARFIDDCIYYFGEQDPQLYIADLYPSMKSFEIKFRLITGCKEMQDYLIDIYEEEKRKVFEPGNQNLV